MFVLWSIFLLFGSGPVFAASPSPSPAPSVIALSSLGLHGGIIVRHKRRHLEIKASQADRMLHVFVPKNEGPPPKNLNISLFKNGRLSRTIRFKAVPEVEGDSYHYKEPLNENEESLQNASAMGFGVEFDLDPKAP